MMKIKPPRVLDELVVLGCSDVIPCPRKQPYVRSAVLIDPLTGTVYYPPFDLVDGLLSEVGGVDEAAEFERSVENEYATRLYGAPARSDGCFYWPAGSGDPEYTSLSVASSRLREFAELKASEGDKLLRRGLADQALAAYERAAASCGRPEDYARMLLTNMPESRRARIKRLLSQVATLPPEQHIAIAIATVWGPIQFMGWTSPPPGYEIRPIKHEDGGFLVMDERKVVISQHPTSAVATRIAWTSYKAKKYDNGQN